MSWILFITNKLRPNNGPEALQSTMIAKYMSANCEAHVISTTQSPKDIGSSKHYFVPEKIYSPTKTRIENFYSKFGKNMKLCFPDSNAGWTDEATQKASEIIKSQQIKIIITRSMPVSTHMIGLALKKKYPEIRWIASLSDPISINPYQNFISKELKKQLADYEKEIFNKADIITHTNTFVIDEYNKIYPEHKSKHIVLSNMFDRSDVEKTRHLKLKSDPMILSFAGRLYGQRSPESIFSAIQLFAKEEGEHKIKLNIIGAGKSKRLDTKIKKYGLKNVIELIPFLDKEKLAKKLIGSHMLVSIDGNFPGNNIFSPSKNFDYLSLTVPILGITKEGPTAALIDETKAGYWASPDDTQDIYMTLTKHYDDIQKGYDFAPDHEKIMKYHAKSVIKQFYDEIIG